MFYYFCNYLFDFGALVFWVEFCLLVYGLGVYCWCVAGGLVVLTVLWLGCALHLFGSCFLRVDFGVL